MHHAGLKKVLQKLIVNHAPPCLNFQYKTPGTMVGVGVERFLSRSVSPEKDRYANLFISALTSFDLEAYSYEMLSERFKNQLLLC